MSIHETKEPDCNGEKTREKTREEARLHENKQEWFEPPLLLYFAIQGS